MTSIKESDRCQWLNAKKSPISDNLCLLQHLVSLLHRTWHARIFKGFWPRAQFVTVTLPQLLTLFADSSAWLNVVMINLIHLFRSNFHSLHAHSPAGAYCCYPFSFSAAEMTDILGHSITSRNGTIRGKRNKVRGEIKRFSELASPAEQVRLGLRLC